MTREAVFAELYYYLPLIVHDSEGLWEKPGMTNKELLKLWDEAVYYWRQGQADQAYGNAIDKWWCVSGLESPGRTAWGR